MEEVGQHGWQCQCGGIVVERGMQEEGQAQAVYSTGRRNVWQGGTCAVRARRKRGGLKGMVCSVQGSYMLPLYSTLALLRRQRRLRSKGGQQQRLRKTGGGGAVSRRDERHNMGNGGRIIQFQELAATPSGHPSSVQQHAIRKLTASVPVIARLVQNERR